MELQIKSNGAESVSEEVADILSKVAAGESQVLSGVTIEYVDILNGTFIKSDFEELDFFHAFFNKCVFDLAELSYLTLSGGGLQQCSFIRAEFVKSTMVNSVIENVVFQECNFTRATIRNVSFKSVKFSAANFAAATFSECDLRGVDFKSCKFSDTDFVDCLMDDDLKSRQGIVIK